MTNRWLACGLMLQFAVWGGSAYGGDCGRPYRDTCAAPFAAPAAPMTYSYAAPAAPLSYSYAAPTTYSYSMPVTYTTPTYYSAPAVYSYAAPVAAPQAAQAQGLEQNCAGGVSSQGFFLSSVLPLVLPRLIDRLFPGPPDAPPVGDRSRLDRIEERLDRIEAKIGLSRSGNGSLNQNVNRPFGGAQSGEADQDAARQIMQGLSEIQTQLTGMHVSLSRNTATMKKIEGFLEDKHGDEFKNYTPAD